MCQKECDDWSLVGLESWGLNVLCQICHPPEKNTFEAPSYCLFKAPVQSIKLWKSQKIETVVDYVLL